MAWHDNPRIVTDGLILMLDAANPNSYPGTGTDWSDLSGQGNHAISQASAGVTAGKWNSAGYFDLDEGSDIYFLIAGLNNYAFGVNITIDIWQKNTGGDYRTLLQNDDGIVHTSDSLAFRTGREDFYGGANNGTKSSFVINSDTGVSFPTALNVWENITCTYDGANVRVHKNAVFFDENPFTDPINAVPYDLKLFRHYNTGEDYVNPIAIIKIYNTTLTDDEILQNHDAIKGRFGL
jgi:hypothetical protein